jgi:hypothetical protein
LERIAIGQIQSKALHGKRLIVNLVWRYPQRQDYEQYRLELLLSFNHQILLQLMIIQLIKYKPVENVNNYPYCKAGLDSSPSTLYPRLDFIEFLLIEFERFSYFRDLTRATPKYNPLSKVGLFLAESNTVFHNLYFYLVPYFAYNKMVIPVISSV